MAYVDKHEAEADSFKELITATSPDGLIAARRVITEEIDRRARGGVDVRTMVMPPAWYATLDAGIRFPVRVLHATGKIETCQSCQGGNGHDYDRPTIDLCYSDGAGLRACAALHEFGLEVRDIAILWTVRHGLPEERIWRVTLRQSWEERADEPLTFAHGTVNLYAAASKKRRRSS